MATGSKPGPATPGVFDLSEEHTIALESRRTRTGKAPEYIEAVREALKTGAQRGIEIKGADQKTKEAHNRKIGNDLRRSAKILRDETGTNVQVATQTRYDHPKLGSFVAFTVKVVPTASN